MFMDYSAFNYSTVTNVVIPNSLADALYINKTTGHPRGTSEATFANCRSLTSATIPDSWTNIPDGMFGNTLLTTFDFKNVTTVGDSAFSGLNRDNFTIPKLDEFDFASKYYSGLFPLSDAIDENGKLEIPYGVTYIGNSVLKKNSTLKTLVIPSSIESIGNSAFQECSSLKEIYFKGDFRENGLTIGNTAFNACKALTKVYCDEGYGLPTGTTKIGVRAFRNTNKLLNMFIPDTVTVIEEQAFYNSGMINVAFNAPLDWPETLPADNLTDAGISMIPTGTKWHQNWNSTINGATHNRRYDKVTWSATREAYNP